MCKTDESAKFRKYLRILEAMEKRGYFDITPHDGNELPHHEPKC